MIKTEPLDFCRIKKIFDKGFGFLTSLYYDENIFFHFSKIKDTEKREMLNNMKRGEVFVYYTSRTNNGKRRVDKVWLNLAEVPQNMFPDFISRLITELNEGTLNLFEIIGVFSQLKETDKLTEEIYHQIISSKRILENPTVLLKLINENDFERIATVKNLIIEFEHSGIKTPQFKNELFNLLYHG